jgi:hypothetical protein
MIRVNVTIKGTSPLLMHRFSNESISVTPSEKKVKSNKEMTIEEIAESGAYRNTDGILYAPIKWFYNSMMNAGIFHKIRVNGGKPRQVSTRDSSILSSCIWFEGLEASLNTTDYKIYAESAVNQNIKARIMTYRPMIEGWCCKFTIRIDEDLLPENLAHQILTDAGLRIGVGSYRPQHKGQFGTFLIEKWEKI